MSLPSPPIVDDGGLGNVTSSEMMLLGFGLLITILMVVGLVVLIIRASGGKDDA
jgi:hypothetical protein|tara:strand:- start:20443 stop:20604 length:162 start_codon:yes stop_codon:yes gene_type:complete